MKKLAGFHLPREAAGRLLNNVPLLGGSSVMGHAKPDEFLNSLASPNRADQTTCNSVRNNSFSLDDSKDVAMASLKELREKRGALEKKYKDIVNKAESAGRDLTLQEGEECHRILQEDIKLKDRILRMEHLGEWSNQLDQPSNAIPGLTGSPSNVGDFFGDGSFYGSTPHVDDISSHHQSSIASDMDKAVAAFVRNSHGRKVPAEEWDAAERCGYRAGANGLEVTFNQARPTIGNQLKLFGTQNRIQNGLTTFDPGKGGVTVPSGFYATLEHALKAHGPMLVTSEIWTSDDGRQSPWPTIDDTGEEGVLVAESQDVPEGEMLFGATVFRSHKLSSQIVRASQELIDDSAIDIAGEIGNALGIRIGRGANELLTMGNAPNGPRGIVHRATIGKTTASATAISADEILDLVASVDPAYQVGPGVGFMMNSSIFSALLKLKDNYGRFLIGDMESSTVPKLRGWPVYLNQAMPSTMSAGNRTILFGDLSKYKVRMVKQLRLKVLNEAYAKSDEVGFVGFLRFDGDLIDAGTHPVKCLVQHTP